MDEMFKCDHSNESSQKHFLVVLLIMLCRMVLTLKFVDKILKCEYSNESYYVMLYKVVLTFESVDEIQKCGYSNESY